jgi:hypothetical protein
MAAPKIMITLDVEECDIPLEYGYKLSLAEQLEVSKKGLNKFMELVDALEIPITIFCTGVFAENNPDWISQLHPRHELASHGYFHGSFDAKKDLKSSKDLLEKLSGRKVLGFRMARMQYVDESEIKLAGYAYHSSLNPTWIPGRYDHRDKPLIPFFDHGLWNVPASVTPKTRIPLFWLAFKNFPLWFFNYLTQVCLRKNRFVNLYFHPWEFTDLSKYPLPFHVKRGHQGSLLKKLECYLKGIQKNHSEDFITMNEYVKNLSDGK